MPPSDIVRHRPTLLNSCAMAATAAEARFRIDHTNAQPQASRIVALDGGATMAVCGLAEREWSGPAHFLEYQHAAPAANGQGAPPDAVLRTCADAEVQLSDELADADVMVMVAATDEGAHAAAVIGGTCAARGIMTAGLVLAEPDAANRAVASLRPYAMVLLSPRDEEDLTGILAALRV